MRPKHLPRDKAARLLKDLQKEIPHFQVTKSQDRDAIFVTLPREKEQVPVSSRKNINAEYVDTVVTLAQKLATVMVRETLASTVDTIINRVSEGLVKELKNQLPAQQVIIERVASEAVQKARATFKADDLDDFIPVDYQSGLEMVGDGSKSEEVTAGNLDEILKTLSNLDSKKK
jgi:hypothetical protein